MFHVEHSCQDYGLGIDACVPRGTKGLAMVTILEYFRYSEQQDRAARRTQESHNENNLHIQSEGWRRKNHNGSQFGGVLGEKWEVSAPGGPGPSGKCIEWPRPE